MTPKLSICVPSRNRQRYFQETIRALLESPRTDVEFVFTDNSDDASVMNDFMATLKDSRIVYLPSTGSTLSMVDNWERTVEATTGEWVTVIGDDDYADPEIAGLLTRLQAYAPEVDGLSWGTLDYRWPSSDEPVAGNLFVAFQDNLLILPRDLLIQRMFGWDDAGMVPCSGMSIYHSAIHRRLLERIRTKYGRYFENPTVDYDSAIKNIVNGTSFYVSPRPMSVMGVCPLSNTYAVGRLDDMKRKAEIFNREVGRDVDLDEEVQAFPFKLATGLTATVGQTIHWYKTKYKFSYGGWEKNFIIACQRNVEAFRDREAFDIVKGMYQQAVDTWCNGRYRKYFQPVFKERDIEIRVSGFSNEGVFIDYNTPGIDTPAAFYKLVNDITLPIPNIDIRREAIGTVMSSKHTKPKNKAA
ncbi:glycosyltransferase [Rhizobium sp. YJ-22]|uniref:glycosyltransferase family 2 protein n=1 Tax=Rhizobium sp. YJ-22 TaxID=3037556 RepID=UPI002412326E|nr:glycosyltransferase [Rhizobium sp. YJ-22]MDG3575273.1 glycosyltransferase [Rhizobium sp. YJ-22]